MTNSEFFRSHQPRVSVREAQQPAKIRRKKRKQISYIMVDERTELLVEPTQNRSADRTMDYIVTNSTRMFLYAILQSSIELISRFVIRLRIHRI
jgi:hypothetical protein